MSYEVIITGSIFKSIDKFPKKDQIRIFAALENLKENPRPLGVKKLQGEKNAYRIRVGDYRIIYDVNDQTLRILVLKAGHRQDIYKP